MPSKRPLIGCTTYRKLLPQDPPIELDGLMSTYTSALATAGAIPCLIPLSLPDEALLDLLDNLDGLLLPGGGDIDPLRYGEEGHSTIYGVDPLRDHVEFLLAQRAVELDKPILAICRGHQLLNVALGGSLWPDVFSLMPSAARHDYFQGYQRNRISHEVRLQQNSRLAGLFGREEKMVNSLHHQGIKRLGSYLTPAAYAPDGLIEAIEIRDHRFAVGVQWHPEEFFAEDRETLSLFEAFVAAC